MAEPVPDSSAQIIYLRSYSERDRDEHDVVGRVLDVTVEMLREAALADLTTRRIAERAGVPHGELCATSGRRTRSSPRCTWVCCATRR